MVGVRRTWIIGFIMIFAVSISVWVAYRWSTEYDREYARLLPGTPKAEVLKRLESLTTSQTAPDILHRGMKSL